MANDCTLQGLYPCDKFSVGGIRKIWLVPFGDVYNYIYTNDELGKVTTFSSYTLPVEYKTLNGEFVEEYQGGQYNNYIHSLTTSLARLDYQSRNEFEKMVGSYVTAIFKDANGKCWIAGFDRPLRVNRFRAGTGGDASLYTYTMTGNSRYQVKEIECFDFACFASFNGTILRTSTFVIETASTYDFGADWQIVANDDVLTYTPNQALDPTDWSTPATYAQDLAELTNLIGNPGTSITLDYDGGADTATITLQSSDTAYDFLVFNGQTAITSTIADTLNLQLLLSPAINIPGTTVTVSDDTPAVVYSGVPTDVIVGAGLSGTVSNALIDISLLYPSGTTFTATVENDSCETKEYTFVLEQLADCTVTSEVYYDYGRRYSVSVSKNTTFDLNYQKLSIYYDEYEYHVIPDIRFATDTFATVQTAIYNALTADPASPIIASSISITESIGAISISFYSTRKDSYLSAHYLNSSSELVGVGYKPTGVMGIQSFVNAGTTLQITNDDDASTLTGITGNAPVNVGYTIQGDVTGIGTTLINDVEVVVNDYPETVAFDLEASAPSCPTTTNPIDTAVCYDSTELDITRKYELYVADVSTLTSPEVTGQFVFDYTIGATNFALAVVCATNIDGNDGADQLSQAIVNTLPLHLGDAPFKVLSFTFDYATWEYVMELDVHTDVTINSIEGNDLLDVAVTYVFQEEADITEVEITPIMNPHTSVQWIFNDIDAIAVNETGEAIDAFDRYRNDTPVQIADVYYDSGLNQLTLDITAGINPAGTYTLTAYDVTFTLMEDFALNSPTTNDTFGVASVIADVKWFAVHNGFGLWAFIPFDSVTQSDINVPIYENRLNRSNWGRFEHWNALTPMVFAPAPVIVSALCV